jgi:seryl-tRNA synthetase
MLDIKKIREDADEVRKGMTAKGVDAEVVDVVLEHDGARRAKLSEVEELKAKRNAVSKEIGAKKKSGEDTSDIQAEMRDMGERISSLDQEVEDISGKLYEAMLVMPNLPHETTPVGNDESANKVVKEVGKKKTFDFKPKGHIEIGEKLGIIDFPRATRMTGAGFPMLVGQGARLERALIAFMLDMHTKEHGYTEIAPPFLVNSDSMIGTGQLPKMAEDMYKMTEDDLWLVPTAEVPVTNIYREEIIEQELPIYLTAYTPCWRREAGAAGKDTRGMIRVHQFDKVEMVKFVKPEGSYDELESLLQNALDVVERLELSYRILSLCSGDISFAAAKCYDIELWAPGQDDWLEVSSCSNFEDFQARRAKIRYRDEKGKPQFIHTLNGSGVALPRIMVAILENNQQEDGSVILPEAIVPYMDGLTKLTC